MDSLRNMISNLYIYKGKEDFSNQILTNNSGESNKLEENKISNNINTNNINSELNQNYSNSKLNVSRYRYCDYCRDRDTNISNEKKKIKKTFKPSVNYFTNNISYNYLFNGKPNHIKRNKDLIREKEYQMKEERLRKENEALQLLLMNSNQKKNKLYEVNSRLYEYEKNQKINPKFKINQSRAQSSKVNLDKRNLNVKNFLERNPSLNYYNNFYLNQSLKLPSINQNSKLIKETFSNLNLHKDYGRIPEYLIRMKEETRLQKEEEKFLEQEKHLPRGTRILPEEEKKERINELSNMKKELEDELFQMPIARLSKRQIERKGEIEKSLYDIEEELNRLTSYRVVVVKI